MKIRTDFVTNSSSSSFIFGEPNGTTTTVESVVKQVKDIALNMENAIDETINILKSYNKIKNLMLKLEDLHDIPENMCRSKKYKLISSITDLVNKNKELLNKVDEVINKHKIYNYGDLYSAYDLITYILYNMHNDDIELLRAVAHNENPKELPLESMVVDVRDMMKKDPNNCTDKEDKIFSYLKEIVSWYPYEDLNDLENRVEILAELETTDAEIIHRLMGEVVIVGECGYWYMPTLIVNTLEHNLKYACNHMG